MNHTKSVLVDRIIDQKIGQLDDISSILAGLKYKYNVSSYSVRVVRNLF